MVVFLFIFVLGVLSDPCCEDWNYDNPNINWPICCADCSLQINPIQSPILIEGEQPQGHLKPLVFDGYTDLNQSVVLYRTIYRISLEFPDDYSGTFITSTPRQYRLNEIHFHTPAENQVAGNDYVMEMHMVHYDIENATVIAVLSIFFKLSNTPNPWLQQIADNIPKIGSNQSIIINLTGLNGLFNELVHNNKNGYWALSGSLTSPPCSGAFWFILTDNWELSKEQLDLFTIFPNARPIQRSVQADVWRPPQISTGGSTFTWGIIVGVVDVVLLVGLIGFFIMKRIGFIYKKIKTQRI